MLVAGSPALALNTRLSSTPCSLRMIATSSPSARRTKPKHPVKAQSAVEISHSNPDVIDPLDCDVLGHRDLPASVVGWARCSSRHDTIAEREQHESNSSSIDQHVALRAPNMPMHQVVVWGRSGLYDAALNGAVRTLGPTS